jgi:enterochelin esterase-like enzyme
MPRPPTRKVNNQPSPGAGRAIAGGTLFLHELRSRVFSNARLVRVWTPPGYVAGSLARYPVLYLNDGQNLFDPATAFAGVDWQVGETATRLIAEKKIPPIIIVGIDNTGKNRIREYIPYKSQDPRVPRPLGTNYPQFLRTEVMPLVQGLYPVLKGAENTALGGSSLGGLITLYTQLTAPRVFGRLLIESPSLFVANRKILQDCRSVRSWPARVYLGIGTNEVGDPVKDEQTVDNVRELAELLAGAGLDETRLRIRIEEGATHNEAAWAARFPDGLQFLFSEGTPNAAMPPSKSSSKSDSSKSDSPAPARKV